MAKNKFVKGSIEAKEFMAKVRAMKKNTNKKGDGLIDDAKNYVRSNAKNILKKGIDYGASELKKKLGDGLFGDVLKGGTKLLKNEVLNRAPLPSFIKEPISNVADKGIDLAVGKTGLGLKSRGRPKKNLGGALLVP